MSNLSDLPINDVGSAARVYVNDTALSTYLQNVTHRDKKSPWSVWTETYSIPYIGKLDSFYAKFERMPFIQGKVTERYGRRFLGGSVFASSSAKLNSAVDPDAAATKLSSNGGDQVILHMYRSLLPAPPFAQMSSSSDPNVDDLQQYITDRAEKIQESERAVWLCKPRLYSNEPTVTNYSLELPVDSNYIGKDEYWTFLIEPCDSTGAASNIGWNGVTINLRFAALLEE